MINITSTSYIVQCIIRVSICLTCNQKKAVVNKKIRMLSLRTAHSLTSTGLYIKRGPIRGGVGGGVITSLQFKMPCITVTLVQLLKKVTVGSMHVSLSPILSHSRPGHRSCRFWYFLEKDYQYLSLVANFFIFNVVTNFLPNVAFQN